jgi:hypothetical protein
MLVVLLNWALQRIGSAGVIGGPCDLARVAGGAGGADGEW